jgi:hypothetical protein
MSAYVPAPHDVRPVHIYAEQRGLQRALRDLEMQPSLSLSLPLALSLGHE